MSAIDHIFDPQATTIPVLRYLVAVAAHRHFGRAAEACGVAQPTLSAQVSKWERRSGIAVFERDSSGVRVTPLGERVISSARKALRELERLEQLATQATPPFYGPLRIGIIQSLAAYVIPLLAPIISTHWPRLEWSPVEGLSAGLIEDLRARRLDAVLFAEEYGIADDLRGETIFEEAFHAALPAEHPLAEQTQVQLSELAGDTMLLLDDGHCLREHAIDICHLRATSSGGGADYRAASLETLRQLVALGYGVTLLPALAAHAQAHDSRLVIRPIADPEATRRIGLIWLSGDVREAGFQDLCQALRADIDPQFLA